MSAYKRVMDYMSGAPDSANHIKLWEKAQMDRMRDQVDALELEKRMLGPAERDLMAAFHCQPKFTRKGMNEGLTIGVNVDCRTSSGDKVSRIKNVVVDFNGGECWEIAHAAAHVDYVTRDPAFYTLDTTLRDKIISQCPGMSAAQLYELRVDGVKDSLSLPVDMRHMYMKMMLMLWDYTLAATSKVEGMEMAEDIVDFSHPSLPADARMATVANYRVVVDAEGMSRRELGLLSMAGQQYPSVWYAGDNIYTKCHLAEDSLAIVSDGKIDMDTSGMWGSPDELYSIIWSIACKTSSTKCLAEAITLLRGKCQHMADFTKRAGPITVQSGVPLSVCKVRSVGAASASTILQSQPGYFSTSLSLVTDLLYGKMFEISATSVVEQVGGLGDRTCGEVPSTDRMYNGLLRDIGLRHEDGSINAVLKNWCSLTGSAYTFGYGGAIKDYVIKLTELMRGGWDVELPQLGTLIPFMDTKDTCWGYSRGYPGKPDVFDKDQTMKASESLSVCAWLMGLRATRPKVGHNRSKKESRHQTPEERELAVESKGKMVLGSAQLWITDGLGGREDDYEEGSGVLVKSSFPSVKCQLLYDERDQEWHIPTSRERDYTSMVRRTTMGEHEVEVAPVIVGPAPKSPEDIFSGVRAAVKERPVRPYKEPRPAVGMTGVKFVPRYVLDGKVVEDPIDVRTKRPATGEMRVKAIDVPGDGKCGLHAVVQDLQSHGLLTQRDGGRVLRLLDKSTNAPTFHSPEDIAGAVLKLGLGLDVVAGGIVHSYGNNDGHRVLMQLKDHHYMPIVEHEEGETLNITSVQEQVGTDDEYIKRLGEFERMLAAAT
ncbi:putative cysteine protease [Cryphonectria nitschkei chrysovirus 1]|uniref:Putative cysteine protease n=1 Tax=Cryphonectria nitschkei chrysovirus 1 TaxID=399394 RepID=D6QX89_9VIRU|nr:putative cysteine protease [Cryphonectria nitschkei chrysovirus 1]ADG27459.1 putative cysteine protease [Cryphonectria nitschkei chrysovirus 1]